MSDKEFVPDDILLKLDRLSETQIVRSKMASQSSVQERQAVVEWIENIRQRIIINRGDFIVDEGPRSDGRNYQFMAEAITAVRQLIALK
jgi:hypothetical protein